jgi:hypothetical protein
MWRKTIRKTTRKTIYAAGVLSAACATALLLPYIFADKAAADFEARWQAMVSGGKSDRLMPVRNADRQTIFSFSLPQERMLVIIKRVDAIKRADDTAMDQPAPLERSFRDPSLRASEMPSYEMPPRGTPVRVMPVRQAPQDERGQNRDKNRNNRLERLPIGCEPSFSPVTVPSMAHISGRCLS